MLVICLILYFHVNEDTLRLGHIYLLFCFLRDSSCTWKFWKWFPFNLYLKSSKFLTSFNTACTYGGLWLFQKFELHSNPMRNNRCCHLCCTCMCTLSCSVIFDSWPPPWTVACQTTLSTGLSRQKYWSGLPFPSPG